MSEELLVVGKRLPRVDAFEKATGKAKYTVDMKLPGMLYGKILRSPHAHARILKIDTSRAEKMSGVKAVITHKDVPGIMYKGLVRHGVTDEYILDEKVRYVGDKVAAVAAISEEIAEEALELIDAEYEVLPAVFTPQDAMKPDAPQIHPKTERNLAGDPVIIEIGDVEKGFKEADYIFEDTYKTSRQAHCCPDPYVCIASWDETGKLTFWSANHGAFFIREELAQTLGMPFSKVRVIIPPGSGFGSRYGFAEDALCALLAKKAGRPVKLGWTREEEFYTTRTRHPWFIEIKTGVKKDGTFTARQMKAFLDTGAFRCHGTGTTRWGGSWFASLYRCPNIRFEGHAVYTNNPVAGAFRGYGNPQAHFAMESQIDTIAEKLGMDPLEIRLKNHIRIGDINPVNRYPTTSCGLDECIQKGAERIGWERRQKKPGEVGNVKKRGIGMACFIHGQAALSLRPTDPEKRKEYWDFSTAIVRVNEDGSVNLLTGMSDIGQGSSTVFAQIASEELGVRLEDVTVTAGDTETTTWDYMAVGSRATITTGGAVKAAAADAKRQLLEQAAKMLEVAVNELVARGGRIYVKGAPDKGLPISDVVRAAQFSPPYTAIIGKSTHEPAGFAPPFGAHFAEVEVDTETGQVKVLKIVAAHDVGKAVNPDAVEGQIEGGLQQGIGYAITEDLVLDESGRPLNTSFIDYKVLKAPDMPEIEVIIVEPIDPIGPFGAKGVGETAMVPVAAAIANAIYNATGVRIKELTMTAEKVLSALKAQRALVR